LWSDSRAGNLITDEAASQNCSNDRITNGHTSHTRAGACADLTRQGSHSLASPRPDPRTNGLLGKEKKKSRLQGGRAGEKPSEQEHRSKNSVRCVSGNKQRTTIGMAGVHPTDRGNFSGSMWSVGKRACRAIARVRFGAQRVTAKKDLTVGQTGHSGLFTCGRASWREDGE
jgi:hypothetical protein